MENSELLSAMLNKEKIPHQVLNAKQHAREADIVARRLARRGDGGHQHGRPGNRHRARRQRRETDCGDSRRRIHPAADKEQGIATQRAEWQFLHEQVLAAGGLHIIGSERHESRRIDNQLRGRSGRQGDHGSSRFYLSLDDPLLRIFAGERLRAIMDKLKMPEGEAIEHPLVSRSLESAQRKVEARNFDIRKQLLEYDDVANDQRKVIYQQRNELLETEDISETIVAMRHAVIAETFRAHVPANRSRSSGIFAGLEQALASSLQIEAPVAEWFKAEPTLSDEEMLARIVAQADASYRDKVELVGAATFHPFERNVMLQVLDTHWREHLAALDHLRQGIHLRGYAQKNPKQEYKREAFELFENLLDSVRREVTRIVFTSASSSPRRSRRLRPTAKSRTSSISMPTTMRPWPAAATLCRQLRSSPPRPDPRLACNDPCPCGSGKVQAVPRQSSLKGAFALSPAPQCYLCRNRQLS